jgi:conjugal transfer pilus assembly protein TraL
MNENLKLFIPKNLDASAKVFIWELDVAMIFIAVLGVGIVLGAFILPLIIALILCAVFQKMKSGRSRGYSIHLMYWYSPMNIGNRRTPPSSVRSFVG